MADPKSLFTKAALERLSSPEQLDMLMRVTSPIGWLALDTVGVCLFIGLLWGIFGTIPNKVDGKGILIRGGSVLEVEAGATGRVTKVFVEIGDVVTQGQAVASIGQSGLSMKIDNAKALLSSLVDQNEKSTKAELENSRSALDALSKERVSTDQSIKDYQSQLAPLQEKVKNQEELQAKGLLTQSAVMGARQQLFAMQEKISGSRVRLTQMTTEEGTIRKQLQEQKSMRETRIDEARRSINELQGQMEGTSKVVSPYTGRVVEVGVSPGKLVTPDVKILTMETLDTTPLEGVIYIPAGDGKKVQPGMQVRVSPSTVRAEEFGFMVGTVKSISGYPSSPESMLGVLGNGRLVQDLSGSSSPLKVIATLQLDPATKSGYKWSSPNGPPVGVFGGTLCSASIVVSERKPIGFVIPLVRETLGIH
ncbi:MAG: NHLP bacteriocin system secretion protein [Chthoniobacter sp.]|uniref:NHLP bacteriocin system secretion protein n=1 Tax=Chthoniobacter sp. TaxID=2510640 RepID=UPI0032A8F7BB